MFDLNPITYNKYGEMSDAERADICTALLYEYRGDNIKLDQLNISNKIIDATMRDRLNKLSCYLNIIRRVTDIENCQYSAKSYKRTFLDANKTQTKHLEHLYNDLNATVSFSQFEKEAGLLGTVIVGITQHPRTKKLSFIKLTPNLTSLKIVPDPIRPNEILEISYERKISKNHTIRYLWDLEKYYEIEIKNGVETKKDKYSHGYHSVPFAILRYVNSPDTFFGPIDYESYSICQQRSYLIANSILRTQNAVFDTLFLRGGWGDDDVNEAADKLASRGILVGPAPKLVDDKSNAAITPDATFIHPSMIAPETIFNQFEKLYEQYLKDRGIPKQQFETSSDPSSADALRISSEYLLQQRLIKREALKKFEQDLFDIIKHYNNSHTDNVILPDKIEMVTDFYDPVTFNSTSDRIQHYEFQIRNNLITPPQILQQENPDLTIEQAEKIYKANKEFNMPNDPVALKEEVAGEKPLGNPIEKGQDSKGTYVRYGKSGTKYYYTDEGSYKTALQKAEAQAKAIYSSGYKE